MRQKLFLFFIVVSMTMLGVLVQAEEAFFYVVNPGDTLSSIAIKVGTPDTPLYGAGGRLDKILQLNPHIQDPNRIVPGDKISVAVVQQAEISLPTIERNVAQVAETAPVEVPQTEISQIAKDLGFGFKVGLLYSKLNAIDPTNNSTAVFTSELVPEISLFFIQPISSDFVFYSEISSKQNKFKAPSTGQTIEQAKATLNLYGLIQKNFSSNANLGIYFGLKEKLFTRAVSASTYTFDVGTVPVIGLNLKYDLLSQENRKAGANVSYGFLQSSKASAHEVKQGYESRLGLFLENKRSSFSFEQEVFIEVSKQSTHLVNQNETAIGLLFKFENSF